jgi:acetyltransferase-like isoleucine patch superfamily enzyme
MGLVRLLKIHRAKSKFLAPHTRRWTRARVKWAFMRRECYVGWPIYGHVLQPLKEGRLELGKHVTLLPGCWFSLPRKARIRIGRGVYLNGDVMVHSYELIEIGEFCAIGRGTIITDGTHNDPSVGSFDAPMRRKGPVRIGSHVQISNNCAVMGGVTIGDHAFVASNSVVTHDVEPYTLVGGVPAKLIKRLDPVVLEATGTVDTTPAP